LEYLASAYRCWYKSQTREGKYFNKRSHSLGAEFIETGEHIS
jgi:hypothetical protein